jgi:hypothetical protein
VLAHLIGRDLLAELVELLGVVGVGVEERAASAVAENSPRMIWWSMAGPGHEARRARRVGGRADEPARLRILDQGVDKNSDASFITG